MIKSSGIFVRRNNHPLDALFFQNILIGPLTRFGNIWSLMLLSKDRVQDWGADDAFENGYLENIATDKRVYESDPSDKADRNLQRAPL